METLPAEPAPILLRPGPRLIHLMVDPIRRVLTASILFLLLFLFVRTFALEPFGVPTGSMANSFFGNHRELDCPRCGYAIILGEPQSRDRGGLTDAGCPNCGQMHLNFSTARELPGDRLLVDKNVYNLRSPRRWEVAVFRCPVDSSKPYVKRVVGLPGEALLLDGGDVFANGQLERKTLAQCRECWVPAFDHAHAPPGGWGARWLVETLSEPPVPAKPATVAVLHDGAIHLDASTPETPALGLTHRNWNLNTETEEPFTDWLAYNGGPSARRLQTVHDFAAVFDLEVAAGSGSFACRLSDGLDSVFVQFPIGDSDLAGTTLGRDGPDEPLQTGLRLQPGKTYHIEFSFIDRRASLAVDGKAIPPALDLPAENLALRQGVTRPVQLGVRGANVLVRNFMLYRDVHLRADGTHGTRTPHQLAADEYFVCGDNSNNSHDSREWAIPGVPEASFLGKPFLIHQPLKLGRMTVGGQERQYQAIDWSRLRWVR